MDIKYEFGIVRRNLTEDLDNRALVIEQQTLELNKVNGRHIRELQSFKGDKNERLGILNQQSQEINEIKGRHIRELQKLSRKINASSQKVDSFCKLVEHYSGFDSKKIGEVLAEILSTLKGQEYIYQETLRYTSKVDENGKRVPLVIPYRIIIEKKLAHDSYLNDNISLDDLVNGNMALLLDKGLPFSERQIHFYCANEKEHDLNALIKFKMPSFFKDRLLIVDGYVIVAEFIDFLIEYKITNKIESIPLEKLNELKEGFIKSKQLNDEKVPLVKK